MKYMLLIYDDEIGWAKLSEAKRQHSLGESGKLRQAIAWQHVAGSRLHPTSATTTIRTHNGAPGVISANLNLQEKIQ